MHDNALRVHRLPNVETRRPRPNKPEADDPWRTVAEGYAPGLHDDLAAMLDKFTTWLAATSQTVVPAGRTAAREHPTDEQLGAALCDQADLAAILRVSQRTIRKMDAAGELPPSIAQRGKRMYQRAEILRWIAADRPCRDQWEANGRK